MLRAEILCIPLMALLSSNPEAHEIYTDLRNKAGKSCCDSYDCRPARYRIAPSGNVEMLVYETWLPIPKDALEYRALEGDSGQTRGGHWCGPEVPEIGALFTYCAFLPPTLGHLNTPMMVYMRDSVE
jgi:hypothetical protein